MDRKERARKIKSEMVLRGITNTEVAKSLGVTQQLVSLVIYGQTSSARVTTALIDAGIPENLLREDAS